MLKLYPVLILFWLLNDVTSQKMTQEELVAYRNFLANQKRLYTDLFKDYDSSLSAIYTLHSSPYIDQNNTVHPPMTELKLTMTMMKLVDVVEVEEKVTFLFDYIAQYFDQRLSWDPMEYGGITHFYVPQNKVWLPEITIADAHEVKFFESDDAPRIAWVHSNGSVGFYTSTVSSVICQLDVYKFPMDSHECGVSILFHSYYPTEYRIKTAIESFAKPLSELGSGEWKVTHIGLDEQASKIEIFSSVQRFVAKIERNPSFYISLVMIPAFFINVLSIIALFINIENIGEKVVTLRSVLNQSHLGIETMDKVTVTCSRTPKVLEQLLHSIFDFQITVGLTNIMAMTFILVILAADLPKTARIPLLAIYVIVGLVIVMVSIAAAITLPFIRKYQKRRLKSQDKPKEPSRFGKFYNWLRIEYILMFIFQIANLVNFIILFV
ncbi:unnamed protein product [Caenorhabditis brenneri]